MQAYADAVKGFEGFAPRASWDYKQNTNGYGTQALSPGEVIDRPEAERRFADAWSQANASVNQFAPNAPEGVKAALASLTFNAGPGWQSAGLGSAVRAGDWDAAKQHFLQYNKAGGQVDPGLVSRRATEAGWFNNSAPGALSMAQQPYTVFPPGNGQGQPALSAGNVMGAGALSGGGSGIADALNTFNSGNALQQAGAFLMARDDPKALGALEGLQDKFTVIQGRDGRLYRVSTRTGAVQAVTPGDSSTVMPVTPGEKSADETFAKDYTAWNTGGKASNVKALGAVDSVLNALKNEKDISGPTIGILPDSVLAVAYPRALATKQQLEGSVQGSLKATLGSQYTEKEGTNLLARAFDPRLSQEENIKKVQAIRDELASRADATQQMSDYFEKHHSVSGFRYVPPTAVVPEATVATAPAAATTGAVRRYNPKTGKIE